MSRFQNFFTVQENNNLELAYRTMREMIQDAETEGFTPKIPIGKKFIHPSKQDNMQFILGHPTLGNRYVRISANLNAALLAKEDIDILEQPVYCVRISSEDGRNIMFLTVGLTTTATEDFDITMLNKPEPAEV